MKKLFLLLAFLVALTTTSFAGNVTKTPNTPAVSELADAQVATFSSQVELAALVKQYSADKNIVTQQKFPCALVIVFDDGSVLILFGDCTIIIN